MKISLRTLAFIVLFLGLIISFVLFDPSALSSKQTHSEHEHHHHAAVDYDLSKYCQLSQHSCEQQGITMQLEQDIVSALTSTPMTVYWPNSQQDQLVLTLEGLEMEMGQPKFVLKRTQADQFIGELFLPACSMGSMTWVGKLTDGQKTVFPAIRMH